MIASDQNGDYGARLSGHQGSKGQPLEPQSEMFFFTRSRRSQGVCFPEVLDFVPCPIAFTVKYIFCPNIQWFMVIFHLEWRFRVCTKCIYICIYIYIHTIYVHTHYIYIYTHTTHTLLYIYMIYNIHTLYIYISIHNIYIYICNLYSDTFCIDGCCNSAPGRCMAACAAWDPKRCRISTKAGGLIKKTW